MGMPPWTIGEKTYVTIEGSLGLVPVVGGLLTSVLKLVLQTDEEKRQKENPTIVKMTQEEYNGLEHKDENTLYLIVPKKGSKE